MQRCVGPGFIHAKGWRLDGACRYYCQNDALIRVVMRQIPSVKRIPSGRSRWSWMTTSGPFPSRRRDAVSDCKVSRVFPGRREVVQQLVAVTASRERVALWEGQLLGEADPNMANENSSVMSSSCAVRCAIMTRASPLVAEVGRQVGRIIIAANAWQCCVVAIVGCQGGLMGATVGCESQRGTLESWLPCSGPPGIGAGVGGRVHQLQRRLLGVGCGSSTKSIGSLA